jgi:thiol-disulfide isomerase/thioredoxin
MAQFAGKVVLIDFWATWCGPCRAEMPNILANYRQYRGLGFEVIAISVDRDLKELQKFVIQEQPPWTVVADHHPANRNHMGDRYGIRGIPAFILLGRDGKVAAVNCRGEQLGQKLAQLLGGPNAVGAQN